MKPKVTNKKRRTMGVRGATQTRCGVGSITVEPKALTSATKRVQSDD